MHSLGEVEWTLLGSTAWQLAMPGTSSLRWLLLYSKDWRSLWETPFGGLGSPYICHFTIKLSPFGHLTIPNVARSFKFRTAWCSTIMMHRSNFRPNALLEMKKHVWILEENFKRLVDYFCMGHPAPEYPAILGKKLWRYSLIQQELHSETNIRNWK